MSKSLAMGVLIGATLGSSVGSVFKSLSQRAKETQEQLAKLRLGEKLAVDLQKYRAQLVALQSAQHDGTRDAAQLQAEIGRVTKKYDSAREAAGKYGLTLGNVVKEHGNLVKRIDLTTAALKRQRTREANSEIRNEVKGELLGTVGTVMVAAAPIRAAIAFESVMADVKKVVNFDSPAQFKAMSADLLQLSTVMPMAASGMGAIMAAAGQSGIVRKDLLAFTKDAVTMGVAFDLTGDEAGAMMANWRSGMKLTQGQAVRLADAVNYLSNNMNAKAGAVGEVLQRQGAVAMAAGLTETQAASLGAALLSSGAGSEIAATAMKNLTGALTKGYAVTKSQERALGLLRLDANRLAKGMQTDAAGTIVGVFKAIAKAAPEKRGALVSDLFGEESRGAIMPLLSNLENLRNAFALTAKEERFAASMQAEYSTRSKTTANNLQLLQNRTTALGIGLGTVLLPGLNTAMEKMGGLLSLVSQGAERFPRLTEGVVGTGVGLAGLRLATLGAKYAWSLLSDAWVGAKAVYDFIKPTHLRLLWDMAAATRAWAIAQEALNTAWALSPIGAVLSAVAGTKVLANKYRKELEAEWNADKKRSPFALPAVKTANLARVFPAAAAGLLAMAPMASHASNNTTNMTASITVHAAPGVDARQVAELVASHVRELQSQADARARSALYDGWATQ